MSTYTQAAWDHAVATARDALETERQIVRPECWGPMHIVQEPDGRLAVYSADAWEEPVEAPMLPWHVPQGDIIAVVQHDGTVQMGGGEHAKAA